MIFFKFLETINTFWN